MKRILVVGLLSLMVMAMNQGPVFSQAKVNPQILAKIKEALPAAAPAKPKQARKVLLFSKTNGFRHGSIPVGVASLTMLGAQTGAFTATHSEDEAMFEPDTLKQFDAVIMVNTTGELFRPRKLPADAEQKKAALAREERLKQSLVDFVRGGKGLGGTHSATDTYKNWKEYNTMMGGAFAGHPWHTEVPVRLLDASHPLNKVFQGKGFTVRDEIYQFRDPYSRENVRVLLSLDPAKTDMKKRNIERKDGDFAVAWIRQHGEGRVFYCSLGHREDIYWNPQVLQFYLDGLQYVLGDLDGDATASN